MNEKKDKRKKFGTALVQYIRRTKRDRNNNIQVTRDGVLVSDFVDDKIIIGFSLAHKHLDVYNFVKGRRVEDFGFGVAKERAAKWQNSTDISVPDSIKPLVVKFIDRSRRYYKGKKLPAWAEKLITF
jgi:hypothetical protein